MTEHSNQTTDSFWNRMLLILVTFVLALIFLGIAFEVATGTNLGIEVVPARDDSTVLTEYDDVVIVDNCSGTSVQVIPPHDILPETANIAFSLDPVDNTPLLKSLGVGGATLDISSNVSRELHDEQLARLHAEAKLRHLPLAQSRLVLVKEFMIDIPQNVAAANPIDTVVFPEVEVRPGFFSISTMRWERTWETGVITVTTPSLPMGLFNLTNSSTYYYGLEVRRDFVGTKTEQLDCGDNLRDAMWKSWISHFSSGDQNAAVSVVRSMIKMYPGDGLAQKALVALTDASTVEAVAMEDISTTGQLQEGSDLAIRGRPCFPGKEGDSSVNYISALRQGEFVTILSEPVADECGFDMNWLLIRTLEGLEGYVSSSYLLVPNEATFNNSR